MMSDSSSSEWLNFMHRIVKSPNLKTEPFSLYCVCPYRTYLKKSDTKLQHKKLFTKAISLKNMNEILIANRYQSV